MGQRRVRWFPRLPLPLGRGQPPRAARTVGEAGKAPDGKRGSQDATPLLPCRVSWGDVPGTAS